MATAAQNEHCRFLSRPLQSLRTPQRASLRAPSTRERTIRGISYEPLAWALTFFKGLWTKGPCFSMVVCNGVLMGLWIPKSVPILGDHRIFCGRCYLQPYTLSQMRPKEAPDANRHSAFFPTLGVGLLKYLKLSLVSRHSTPETQPLSIPTNPAPECPQSAQPQRLSP